MTSIRIYRKNGSVSGIKVSGHSGYADAGSDIVCAAITAAMRLVDATLNGSMKLGANVSVQQESATIAIHCRHDSAQPVFEGFRILMVDLCDEYPQYINITEE